MLTTVNDDGLDSYGSSDENEKARMNNLKTIIQTGTIAPNMSFGEGSCLVFYEGSPKF